MSGAATITLADFFAALFPDPDGLIELRALPGRVESAPSRGGSVGT